MDSLCKKGPSRKLPMNAFIGSVKGGKFIPDSPREFRDAFIRHEGRRVVVNVKRWQPKRSNDQNAYYWAVVVKFWMEAQGERDAATMHEILRLLYNYKPVGVGAKMVKVGLKTSTLSTAEFSQYLERCGQGFAEEFGGAIPDPSNAVSVELMDEYNKLGNGNERMD